MLNVQPLNGTLGASLVGAQLNRCAAAVVDEVGCALREHRVLVLPDQEALGPDELLAFAEEFGVAERVAHPIWSDVPGLSA